MSRWIKIALAAGLVLILIGGCSNLFSPDTNKTVRFQFQFQFQQSGSTQNITTPPARVNTTSLTTLRKILAPQEFDMVRIMVIDLSAYGSWPAFESTETGKAYMANRAVWYDHGGDAGNWAAWKKFWQDYAPIASDQALEINGREASGAITGVLGFNSFSAAIIKDGRVRYWASGHGFGTQDSTIVSTLTVNGIVIDGMVDDWWDPCLAKAMDLSPEEAVFNAAFKQ